MGRSDDAQPNLVGHGRPHLTLPPFYISLATEKWIVFWLSSSLAPNMQEGSWDQLGLANRINEFKSKEVGKTPNL